MPLRSLWNTRGKSRQLGGLERVFKDAIQRGRGGVPRMRPYSITLPVAACRDAPVDAPTVTLTSDTTEADPNKITLLRGFKCSQEAGLDLAY